MPLSQVSVSQPRWRLLCLCVCALLPFSALAATLQPPLPAGAQPGGAQPVLPPPTLPPPESNLQVDIPPVYERPLNASEGAHVFVTKFVVTGVIGDRNAGIDLQKVQMAVDKRFASIETLVEQQRLQAENLINEGPEGFTPEERDKILKFMQGAVKIQSLNSSNRQIGRAHV